MTAAKRYPRSVRRREALHLVARQYTHANVQKPAAYWDDSLPPSCVAWGCQEDYEVIRQVGKGKYGEVYESTDLRTRRKCVVKIMRPVKEHRLRREIKILRHVRGGPNVVELREVLRDPDTKTPCFVFEFVDAIGFRELQGAVTDHDVRNYMYQLLRALDFCHSKGIMHRDVKPGNVLIDHNKKQLKLIDWGLADFYHPGKEYPVRVATRFYKGPELLVDIRDYDYSLDVWGVGCMLAAMVFKRPVFFRGDDEFDQLVKISRVLGSEGLHRYCDKYGVELDSRLDQLVGVRPVVPWRKFCNADNQHLCSPEAFDLLSRLLMYDHHERLTCAEAMAHPYFAPIRPAPEAAAPTAQVQAAVPGPSHGLEMAGAANGQQGGGWQQGAAAAGGWQPAMDGLQGGGWQAGSATLDWQPGTGMAMGGLQGGGWQPGLMVGTGWQTAADGLNGSSGWQQSGTVGPGWQLGAAADSLQGGGGWQAGTASVAAVEVEVEVEVDSGSVPAPHSVESRAGVVTPQMQLGVMPSDAAAKAVRVPLAIAIA